MKVGIVHGAGSNPDGSLLPHTKARADEAIKAYDNSIVDMLIICGQNEADYIASYILKEGVDRKKIMVEPFSYSTLSHFYYCKMLLFLLSRIEAISKVYPISNYWHIPRLSYDARKILEKYQIECLPAYDPRGEEVKREKRWEKIKFISDRMLLHLGYGKKFREEFWLSISPLSCVQREILENKIKLSTTPYQRELMKLEKLLYKAMKLL